MIRIINNKGMMDYDYIYKPYLYGDEYGFNFVHSATGKCSQCNKVTNIKTTTLIGFHRNYNFTKEEPYPSTVSFCKLHYGKGLTLIYKNRIKVIHKLLIKYKIINVICRVILSYLTNIS